MERDLSALTQLIYCLKKPTYLSSDVEFMLSDVRDKDTLSKALKDVDAVFPQFAFDTLSLKALVSLSSMPTQVFYALSL